METSLKVNTETLTYSPRAEELVEKKALRYYRFLRPFGLRGRFRRFIFTWSSIFDLRWGSRGKTRRQKIGHRGSMRDYLKFREIGLPPLE